MNAALIRFTSMFAAATLAVCGFFSMLPAEHSPSAGLPYEQSVHTAPLRSTPHHHFPRAYALATTSTATDPIAVEDAWGAGKWAGIIAGLAMLSLAVYLIAKSGTA